MRPHISLCPKLCIVGDTLLDKQQTPSLKISMAHQCLRACVARSRVRSLPVVTGNGQAVNIISILLSKSVFLITFIYMSSSLMHWFIFGSNLRKLQCFLEMQSEAKYLATPAYNSSLFLLRFNCCFHTYFLSYFMFLIVFAYNIPSIHFCVLYHTIL